MLVFWSKNCLNYALFQLIMFLKCFVLFWRNIHKIRHYQLTQKWKQLYVCFYSCTILIFIIKAARNFGDLIGGILTAKMAGITKLPSLRSRRKREREREPRTWEENGVLAGDEGTPATKTPIFSSLPTDLRALFCMTDFTQEFNEASKNKVRMRLNQRALKSNLSCTTLNCAYV